MIRNIKCFGQSVQRYNTWLNFQSEHEQLFFKFKDNLPELVVDNDINCALTVT